MLEVRSKHSHTRPTHHISTLQYNALHYSTIEQGRGQQYSQYGTQHIRTVCH